MVDILKPGTMLYHGGYCEVSAPDISKCRKYKDFGQGFYLTTDIEQAKNFAKISLRKAIDSGNISKSDGKKIVSCYEFTSDNDLSVKYFETADKYWLHCIVGHRTERLFKNVVIEMKSYDIIGGKIANDDTNATIFTYIFGAYGEPGSERADEICIGLLLPERLKNQYCFKTPKSLERLVFRKGIIL